DGRIVAGARGGEGACNAKAAIAAAAADRLREDAFGQTAVRLDGARVLNRHDAAVARAAAGAADALGGAVGPGRNRRRQSEAAVAAAAADRLGENAGRIRLR